jgi:hypothetical protein
MDTIPYRLPLVIGATGHRDLRDENILQLKRIVADVIEDLKRTYLRGDTETPIIVLSSLAEGADRLIAQVALDHGATLIAPLPMPPDEFRRDFEPGLKPDAAAEFDRLKDQAIATPVMRYVAGSSPEAVRDDETKRALQYREVGLFIVRHCHVLIALWNGDEKNLAVGGTTEVVSFKRDGIPLDVARSVRASLDAPEIGPVVHVVTPRTKAGERATGVEVCPWGQDIVKLYRGGRIRRDWRQVAKFFASLYDAQLAEDHLPACQRKKRQLEAWEAFATKTGLTRRFNREAARLNASPDGVRRLGTSLTNLFDDPEKDSSKKLSGDPAKECAMKLVPHWCALYQIADTLAQDWRAQFKHDWGMLFGLGFAAIASFEVLTHLLFDFKWSFLLLGLYSLLFAGVFGWFFHARRHQHQERFLDYRALAEALRVAVFWKLVGIGWPTEGEPAAAPRSTIDLTSGDAVADAYPIRQPSELDWVKTCLRTLELLDAGKSPAIVEHGIETDGHAWARSFWVHGQLAFFRRRGPEHDHDAEVLESRSLVLVILSILFAGGLCLLDYGLLDSDPPWNHERWPHRFAILLIGLLPGLAAVWAGYAERLALKAQARQYDRMRVLFERAHDLLQSSQSAGFPHIQTLYAELGAEAMEENAEWVAIYRQRPIRPP